MLRKCIKAFYLNLFMASWAEILVHTKANEDSWFMRLTPSVIASAALPGRTAHVYTCKSADSCISSVLGKATDIQYPLSLWRNCHQASAPKLLKRSKEENGKREDDVTVWDWIQTCTIFMSCFFPQNATWLYGRFLVSRMEPMNLWAGSCPQVLTWNSSD